MELPPLPSPATDLERFLLSPENLPIHDFRASQRLWPREPRVESLYHAPLCPAHTDITVERDPTSGELLGYHEVEVSGVGMTAKNSTSLHRAPGPPSLSVKGDSTNYPFWPGGLQEASIVREVGKEISDLEVNFDTDLLTVPPGFSEGMEFTAVSAGGVSSRTVPDNSEPHDAPPQTVSISEILTGRGVLREWRSGEEQAEGSGDGEKGSNEEVDNEVQDIGDGTSEALDGILTASKAQEATPTTGKEALPTQEKEEWAVKVDLNESVDEFHQRIPNMAMRWPFELDVFQKQAVLHLENHNCVFVAAHTSAGKTVVAEYAIALSMNHMTRTIYTSPIKALSNQKFRDFRVTFGDTGVGLLTGDVQIRPESPCLIMTTEILRSMLYNGSDVIRDVEWVIFDEVHYINDSERGVVWEEVLIMLPEHVGIIMLSATVPNAMEIADWVGRTKQKKMYVISTLKRPVPLKHFLYTGNSKQTSDQLFEIVGEDSKFNSRAYQAALQAKKERTSKAAASFGPKSRYQTNLNEEKNVWLSLVHMLNNRDKLPVVAFTLSRNLCNNNADSLSSLDLTTSTEKSEIHVFFKKSTSLLKGSDQRLPQVLWMRDLLKRGIAVHHSGILPIIKEVIELLFQRGLVKLLFATETFAMGVNMPARTVVFGSTRKHDGVKTRDLFPGEYVQMAGRAGRRGIDTTGTVILLCKAGVPEASDLHKMILGRPTTLESQFRLTYSMLLNLVRVETLRVEDMMKRSFAELDSARHEVDRQQAVQELEQNVGSLQRLDCPVCDTDIDHYYGACARITHLKKKMQTLLLSHPQVLKSLSPGRVVIIYTHRHRYSLAVVLQQSTKKTGRSFTVLMLCNGGEDTEEVANSIVDIKLYQSVNPHESMKELFRPDGPVRHMVVEVDGLLLENITGDVLSVEPSKVMEDYRRRQIPRFRDAPPGPAAAKAAQELLRLVELHPLAPPILHPIHDLRVSSMEFVEMKEERDQFRATLEHYTCTRCPEFDEHFEAARQKAELKEKLSNLKFMLSEASLQLLPEYRQRMEVLHHLGFLSQRGTVELKGRVACEIHSHEVLLTELLFQNVFSENEPGEIAALLSCIVFQQSKCSEPNLTERLQKGQKAIQSMATTIAETERQFGMDTSVEDSLRELKFGLVEVVYEWARGMEFVEITNLTDVLEGMNNLCSKLCPLMLMHLLFPCQLRFV